jgi:CIC family chloride channel protein
MSFRDFKQFFSESKQHYFPIMDQEGKLNSIFSINDVRAVLFAESIEHLVLMKDIGTSNIITTSPAEDLNSVLQKFTIRNIDGIPVVADDDPAELIGMLYRREVIAFYNDRIQAIKQEQAD